MTADRRVPPVASGRLFFVLFLAGVLSVPLVAAPRYFIAKFQKQLGPALIDADNAFIVRNGIAHVREPDPHPSNVCCLNERHYITTDRSDYLSRDWTYEITFYSPANAPDEVLFIGFGEGVPDPEFFTEPANSVYFAIAQGVTGASQPGWEVRFHAHDVGMWSSTYPIQSLGPLGGPEGGTYTARIRKVGQAVVFEILETAIVVEVPDITAAAPFLTQVPTRLFFGNARRVYTFSDMRVLPERRFMRGGDRRR